MSDLHPDEKAAAAAISAALSKEMSASLVPPRLVELWSKIAAERNDPAPVGVKPGPMRLLMIVWGPGIPHINSGHETGWCYPAERASLERELAYLKTEPPIPYPAQAPADAEEKDRAFRESLRIVELVEASENARLRRALESCEDYLDERADVDNADEPGSLVYNMEAVLLGEVRRALGKEQGA